MPINAFLFDAEGADRPVQLNADTIAAVGIPQLLWVDIRLSSEDTPETLAPVFAMLAIPPELTAHFQHSDGRTTPHLRPHVDLYDTCFSVYLMAVQARSTEEATDEHLLGERMPARRSRQRGEERSIVTTTAFRRVPVHFVVFTNILVTVHEHTVSFLGAFERRIKGDTQLGQWNGPSFLAVLLDGHVTGYFRVLEMLETEVDSIDDAALRRREERDLLTEMIYIRRRVALVRQTLLPHREVYATLSHPNFAPFVTPEASAALGIVTERLQRAVEATENARELVLGSFDIFTTQTALRTNEVVKILTVLSALLLPAGVLANLSILLLKTPVYDMGKTGFWALFGGMFVVGCTGSIVARYRKWI